MVTYAFQDHSLWQLFSAVVNQHDLHIEKSREMTATWNLLMCFLWFAQFHSGMSFRVVSRTKDLVDSTEDPDCLFAKFDFMIEHQPEWIINESLFNRTEMHYHFYETGSGIEGNSTTGDVARGGRATAIGLDEFAFVPDGYAMLRATRATTNCRLYNSTPNGTGNAFYDLKKAKIKKIRLHWTQHPDKRRGLYRSEDGELKILDNEFRGVVRDSQGNGYIFPDNYPFRLDGKLRSPWYDCECDRAAHPMEIAQEIDIDYLGSNYQFFDSKVIERIQAEDVRDPVVCGELEFDFETKQPIRFVDFPDGRIKLWINLTPEGNFPPIINTILGGDVAAGTGASNSALSGVNEMTGEKLLEFAAHDMLAEDFADYATAIARWLNNAFLIWDASGPHGRIFGSRVVENHYNNIYWKTAINKITRKPSDIPGFFMNPGDKADAFGKYRRALKDRTFVQRSYEANKECLFYVQVAGTQTVEHSSAMTSQDPTGARASHGDRAVADVVANFALQEFSKKYLVSQEPEFAENTFAGRRRAWEQKQNRDDDWMD